MSDVITLDSDDESRVPLRSSSQTVAAVPNATFSFGQTLQEAFAAKDAEAEEAQQAYRSLSRTPSPPRRHRKRNGAPSSLNAEERRKKKEGRAMERRAAKEAAAAERRAAKEADVLERRRTREAAVASRNADAFARQQSRPSRPLDPVHVSVRAGLDINLVSRLRAVLNNDVRIFHTVDERAPDIMWTRVLNRGVRTDSDDDREKQNKRAEVRTGAGTASRAEMETKPCAVATYVDASKFAEEMQSGLLESRARALRITHRSATIFFVVHGVRNYCRRTAAAAEMGTNIISEMAVEDCGNYMHANFNICTRSLQSTEDAAQFIVDLTDSFGQRRAKEIDKQAERIRALRAPYVRSKTRNLNGATCVAPVDVTDQEGSEETTAEMQLRLEDRNDTSAIYSGFLSLVPGISVERAHAIRREFPTLGLLMRAYAQCPPEQRERLLENIVVNGRRLGSAVSKAVALVCTSVDDSYAVVG